MESLLIIRPTVWISGLGPNSGFRLCTVLNEPMQNLSWSSERFGLSLWVERLRAHYRSKAELLQECSERFSKIFWKCFFYCKFRKEEIDCTTISTPSPDQAFLGGTNEQVAPRILEARYVRGTCSGISAGPHRESVRHYKVNDRWFEYDLIQIPAWHEFCD